MSRIGVVGLVMLTLTLVLASLQIWAYRKALNNAGAFVGSFPNNMPAIDDLVGRTTNKLFIVTDFCAYGHFSNPAVSERYRQALIKAKKSDMRVEIHVYNSEMGRKMTASQFNLEKPETAPGNYTALRENKNQLFNAYFEYHKQHNDPKNIPRDYVQFLQLMDDEQANCVKDLQTEGIEIRTDVAEQLPVFMWVRDDSEEAIFSIYNLGPASREISQDTKNKHIILLLTDISKKYIHGL